LVTTKEGSKYSITVIFNLLANIARLFTLAWATEWSSGYAHWAHDYVWQVAFLMLIAVMWLVWIEIVVKREEKTTISA
jgi:exosortase/archaeosortase family protein